MKALKHICLFALICLLVFSAVGWISKISNPINSRQQPPTKTEIKSWASEGRDKFLHYYKDDRTGLCFTGCPMCACTMAISYVPCSPEVESLLEPWQ